MIPFPFSPWLLDRCHGGWADAALAFFHHTFDYPVKTEGETLEHTGPYGTHMPFVAESHLRPDGYGSLDQQLFQSMPLAGHKYSRFSPNPNFDHQPYVGPFLILPWPWTIARCLASDLLH